MVIPVELASSPDTQVDVARDDRIPIAHAFANGRELELVDEVLRSGVLRDGAMLRRFEERFAHVTGSGHAVAIASPIAAMRLVATTSGWSAGTPIVVGAFATIRADVLEHVLGVHVVEVDLDASTLGVEPEALCAAVDATTRGIVVPDSFGWPAPIDRVREVAGEGCVVVGDLGGVTCEPRARGAVRLYSLASGLELSTGTGAVLCTEDASVAATWRALAAPENLDCRLVETSAAIGLAQLERLPRSVALREMVAADYARLLAQVDGLSIPPAELGGAVRGWSRYWVLVDEPDRRDSTCAILASVGIETDVPTASVELARCPVARDIAARAIGLPCFPQLSPQQQERIVATLAGALAAGRT
jgi:dTDP-4-amino-4,6-dideoxygalactose transaminase